MIRYSKRYWGLPLLLRLYGSSLPRTLPFVFISAGLTLALELTVGKTESFEDVSQARSWWRHPYPYQAFAFIVGFMLVFRSNFGYARYWEARTNLQVAPSRNQRSSDRLLQLMTSKWTDAAIQCLRFDGCTLPRDVDDERRQAAAVFQENLVHLVSLLHGVAVQNLRKDWNLGNLIRHDAARGVPPCDALELLRRENGVTWWLSCKSLGQLGSSEETRQEYYALLPIHVIDGVTPGELEALGGGWGIREAGGSTTRRLTNGTVVPGSAELVQVVSSWLHQLIVERRQSGGLNVEPPLLTRVYQVLSEGMQGFEQCRKVMDTPFPFPWAQFVTACLLIYALTTPVLIASYVTEPLLAVVLDIIAVATYYALNEVARDLEDPFIYDPNDLPLATYQFNFNERLLAIQATRRPMSPAERKYGVQ